MQAKKRYFSLLACGIFVLLCYLTKTRYGSESRTENSPKPLSFLDGDSISEDEDRHFSPRQRRESASVVFDKARCRLENCFDFTKCKDGFKVYVYPIHDKVSGSYSKILTSIQESVYYTPNPDEACLFVLSLDTLDRDSLSKDYVKDLERKIQSLPTWNNGLNHVIFSLYSGTWPEYVEELDFNIGHAILAKASMSVSKFRPNFDVSIPLFSKSHPAKGGDPARMWTSSVPSKPKFTLAFKGKRYLTGIGSETRNALYHIHNNEDIILITTCKHGKNWQHVMDDRCVVDNKQYEMYDYQTLLYNSTFCLVPRGRRLGSFRFLEVLHAACIPVLLSNNWELPFSDVIDWQKTLVQGDERLLLQVPDIVRSVSRADVLKYRQQTQFLWETYFSSVDKIVHTTLEIIKSRIYHHPIFTKFVWNNVPGALAVSDDYSHNLHDYPFYYHATQLQSSSPRFTAVIYVRNSVVISSSPLFKLVKAVAQADHLDKILILWQCNNPPPAKDKWPVDKRVPIIVKQNSYMTISARFTPDDDITTDAILSLDEDVLLTTDEINFAFSVWQSFPDRIVGYPARSHFWDDANSHWGYTSKWTNDYSMVLTGAAFIHKFYMFAYSNMLSTTAQKTVDQSGNCEDILMNFLVSHITKLPPIKVTQRKLYKDSMVPGSARSSEWLEADHFLQRQVCMNTFVSLFGYMPLRRSNMRLDPSLFKDPVSILRKKYRILEKVV